MFPAVIPVTSEYSPAKLHVLIVAAGAPMAGATALPKALPVKSHCAYVPVEMAVKASRHRP